MRSRLSSRALPLLRARPLLTVFVFALLLRAGAVLVLRPDPLNGIDSPEYDQLGRDLLAGHGLALYQGYVRPPLYPMLVAVSYALGGVAVLIAVQIVLGAVSAVLVGELSARLAGDRRAAVPAASAAAVYPWFFQWVGTVASENLFTPLAVAAFLGVIAAADRWGRWPALWAGVLFGVAALARNNIIVVAPVVAAWWLWRSRGLLRPYLFASGVVLGLLPFAIYEFAIGNGLVLGSSGGGLIFYAGNNPDVARFYGGDLSDDEWRDLSRKSALGPEAYVLAGCAPDDDTVSCVEGVPLRDRELFWYRAAWRYMTSRPAEWALLETRKLAHYWRPWVEPRAYSIAVVVLSGLSFTILLALAALGAAKMTRESAGFVAAVAIGATLASVVWSVQLRYRFALLDPVLLASAGPALAWLLARRRTSAGVAPGAYRSRVMTGR